MRKILQAALLALLGAWAVNCIADDLTVTVGELKAKSAEKLSKADLDALIPGASYRGETVRSYRSWAFEKDGTLVASGQRKPGQGTTSNAMGRGSWQVSDGGRLCVDIDWPRDKEKWCRFVYHLGDYYVGVKDDKDDAIAGDKFTLKK
jgi:hypothetical protein